MQLEIINKELNETIGQITLPQAVRLAAIYLKKFYNNESFEELYNKIRFQSNTSLSFQKSEINSLEFIHENEKIICIITLNFHGIFGSSSPLPSHYSEMVMKSLDEDKVLYDFLNLFNHHLQRFIYPIWEKHRYYIQYKKDLSDRFSKYILSFLGINVNLKNSTTLDLAKLIPYIGLLSMKQKSIGSLTSILRHYLSYKEISIQECVLAQYEIPSWQHCALGQSNISLGGDFLIGQTITSRNTKFRITLENATIKELVQYSILGEKSQQVKDLITFALNEHLEHEICIKINENEKKQWQMEQNNHCYIGVNCWIGQPLGNEEIILAQKGTQ